MTWRQISMMTLAVVLVLGVIYKFTHSRPLSDQEQIAALIDYGKQAVEQKSVRRAMSLVSEDYTDNEGLNYRQLRSLATQAFQGARKIQVTLTVNEIQSLQPPHAVVRVAGIVTFSDKEYQEKEDFDLTLHLVKQNGTWKVQRIEGMKIMEE